MAAASLNGSVNPEKTTNNNNQDFTACIREQLESPTTNFLFVAVLIICQQCGFLARSPEDYGEIINTLPRPYYIVHSAKPLPGGLGRKPRKRAGLVSGVEHHEQSVEQRLRKEVLQ